jgi:hypothetical protein
MAFKIGDTLLVVLPPDLVFGTDDFDASLPGGVPPTPPTHREFPDGWIDPPWADDVRILLELARGRTTYWSQFPQLEEQVKSYVDLALSVLYGPVDPDKIQPTNLAELDELQHRLETAQEACRKMRRQLGKTTSEA